ncbi:hypothetical protein PCASD_11794 [Puccinia coronata f. sp. avenae]|uniref:Uncharacterized protein n=1 Tax=Puccinia coronata f. sp. avenae TaxID=200324 RepID=A0A2N5UK09_9BASI|nr:hypothetical protein PCASD_11794 [Puccinia coronata f. sp. avenae]
MARPYCLNNAAPSNKQPQETPGESSSNRDLPTLQAAPAPQIYLSYLPFLAATSSQVPMAPPAPSDRAAPPAVSVPQAMPSQPATHSAQPPLRDCVGPKTYSSMLMGLDEINRLEMEPAYPLDQGIAPSEIFSRAKSTALASNRSTPVPQLGQRRVGSSYALQPASSPRQGDLCGHRDASSRQADHDVQYFPGPMAPVRERKGGQQLLANEDSLESGHLNPRYQHQPLWYAKDDGDIQRLVSQRQAGKDGKIVPNPSPTATQASYHKEAPSHGTHNCGESAFCFPGSYATSRPSSASATSAAIVTPLCAASSQ